jgi:ribose/xylose/arabinose/galactoside ABC-type transport system permease subunit
VSVLGILGVAMALAVIGRGIDLSLVALMAMSVAWTFHLMERSVAMPVALTLGFSFSILVGIITGVLIAYAEVPAIFATLAVGILFTDSAAFSLSICPGCEPLRGCRQALEDNGLVWCNAGTGNQAGK